MWSWECGTPGGLRAANIYQPEQKHFNILTSDADQIYHCTPVLHQLQLGFQEGRVRYIKCISTTENHENRELAMGFTISNLG